MACPNFIEVVLNGRLRGSKDRQKIYYTTFFTPSSRAMLRIPGGRPTWTALCPNVWSYPSGGKACQLRGITAASALQYCPCLQGYTSMLESVASWRRLLGFMKPLLVEK